MMGTFKVERVIEAPIEVVWAALNDIDHTPEWVVGLEKAEIVTPGPYGLGSVYNDYNRLGPFPQVTPWHIAVFEPMREQVHVSDSDVLPSSMMIRLMRWGAHTRLEMIVVFRFMPRLGIVSRVFERLVMERALRGVIAQNQANLNQYLKRTVQVRDGIRAAA